MKIRITFELSDMDRRGIAIHYGQEGLADYKTCRDFIDAQTHGLMEDMSYDAQQEEEEEEVQP